MKEPLLDEVVERPCVAPRFFPFFGHHLGPLLGITLRHLNSRKVSSSVLGFEGGEEDGVSGNSMQLLGKKKGYDLEPL